MLPILQRYILAELLRVFAFVLSVLTVLLVFVGIFREVSENGLGPDLLLKIIPFIVPSLLPFTIPATLLLTVCVVYGRLSGDREVIAAKAAGINVLSLLWPSFFLGAVLSVCALVLTDQVIPWSVANIQRIVKLGMENIFLDVLRTQNQFVDSSKGIRINVMGVEGRRLIEPTFRHAPYGKKPSTVRADEATLEFDLEQQSIVLRFTNAYFDVPSGDGQVTGHLKEFDYTYTPGSVTDTKKPRHLSIREIRDQLGDADATVQHAEVRRDIEIAIILAQGNFDRFTEYWFQVYAQQLHDEGVQGNKLRTELHSRFALSCSCFFFALLGSPFSMLQGRRQFLTSFFCVFFPIVTVYYPVMLLLMNLSKSGTLDPAWSVWVGNALVLVIAAFVLRRALKH